MNIFKEELLVTEKNANNILVYNISIHLAFIIDRFFFPRHKHTQDGLSLCFLYLGHINTFHQSFTLISMTKA